MTDDNGCIGEENGNPLQYSCLEKPRDGGAWWAAVYGVAQSWTQLNDLVVVVVVVVVGVEWLLKIEEIAQEMSFFSHRKLKVGHSD